MGKPFDLEEFLLRVKSLVKRSNAQHSSDDIEFKFGGNSVNFSTYAVSNAQGDELTFSQKEIKLLRLLVDHQDKVVSRNQILEIDTVNLTVTGVADTIAAGSSDAGVNYTTTSSY